MKQTNRNMKNIFSNILVSMVLAAGFATACQEYAIDSQPEGPLAIQVDAQDSYTLLATAPSKVVFNVSSNTPWTIVSDQQWCVPTPAMSAASSLVSEIVVTTEDNTGAKARTATLQIKAEGIEEVKTITITQASKENLVVVPFDERVDSYGETISFTIVSNKPWQVIPSTAFLSDIDKKSGNGSEDGAEETVSITVPANPGAVRTGEITVKTDFGAYTFEITQNGVVIEPEEELADGVISIEKLGGTATIKMRYNQEWKAVVPEEYASWLTVTRDGDNMVVTAAANNLMIARVGKFTLTTVDLIDGFEGVEFTVQQGSAWQRWLAASAYTETEDGYLKVTGVGNSGVVSGFTFRKGRVVFEFDEISLADNSALRVYLWPYQEKGNSNLWIQLETKEQARFVAGGSWSWARDTAFKHESMDEVRGIKTLEVIVESDPDNEGKERLTLKINGVQRAQLSGRTDPATVTADFTGHLVYLGVTRGVAADYFVVKSITYYPAE